VQRAFTRKSDDAWFSRILKSGDLMGERTVPRIKVNGVELYYELHGPEDGDVLVLSNGILMSTGSWAYQKEALSRHNRLLLYDCRGMWNSEHPSGPYSMELHADDLATLLDALEIGQAHIGGISYGAEVSMVFALRFPQRVQSLILASSVSHSEEVLRGMIGSWRKAVIARSADQFFQNTYWQNFSAEWIRANQAVLQATAQRYLTLDYEAVLELIDCFSRLDIKERLAEIKAPTLVMVGEDDILKPRPYSEFIASRIANAELVIVPHAGHALCLEKPEVFNTLVLGFLAKHRQQKLAGVV
jgi:3-oxoadipate enol-lactonase